MGYLQALFLVCVAFAIAGSVLRVVDLYEAHRGMVFLYSRKHSAWWRLVIREAMAPWVIMAGVYLIVALLTLPIWF